jgi:hypothetical protein
MEKKTAKLADETVFRAASCTDFSSSSGEPKYSSMAVLAPSTNQVFFLQNY